ncbi:hypothetical protein GAO09_08655 [Rhizobiales bacterium RZME27]|uniref:Uncharacterized protein n=1 Tax=Endobacterium cereale TaxID=2663029 RepID=A0A6A8A4H7_9HYPH|nr:hypothetical protein [Endobacterium cereale]
MGVTSCTIITAPAVQHIAHIHTRMPIILDPSCYSVWPRSPRRRSRRGRRNCEPLAG